MFTIWYVLTLLYMGNKSWSGGVFIGSITCFGIIGWMGVHLKAYLLDQGARVIGDCWVFMVFDITIILSLLAMYIKFAVKTTAPMSLRIGLGISSLFFLFFNATNEDVQDFTWHSKHSILRLTITFGVRIAAFYLDRSREEAVKKVKWNLFFYLACSLLVNSSH